MKLALEVCPRHFPALLRLTKLRKRQLQARRKLPRNQHHQAREPHRDRVARDIRPLVHHGENRHVDGEQRVDDHAIEVVPDAVVHQAWRSIANTVPCTTETGTGI